MKNQKTQAGTGRIKILGIFLSVLLLLPAGCERAKKVNGRNGNGPTGVNDVLSSMEEAENTTRIETIPSYTETTVPVTSELETTTSTSADGVDIDLTILSSTAVFAEVLGMAYEPERYKGKTVKMKGAFSVYYDDPSGRYLYACLVQDATACCTQGIEFSLKGDPRYPEDYPEVGTEITVIGTFDSYEEGNYLYLILREASFV